MVNLEKFIICDVKFNLMLCALSYKVKLIGYV